MKGVEVMVSGTERAWLGLDDEASPEAVAATRARLEEFLKDAPPELAGWARGQLDGTTRRPVAGGVPSTTVTGGATNAGGRKKRSPLLPLVGLAAAVAIGVGVYNIPDGSTTAAPKISPSATAPADAMHAGLGGDAATPPPLDEKRVAELKKQIEAKPKDTKLLHQLANEYSKAAHFEKATQTQARIVELEPNNTDARLALGVARFNTGNAAEAEKQWKKVLEQNPKSAEAWYDLGFLYFTADPPRMDEAEAAWKKVVEIDPTSELAKTVSSHLEEFKKAVAPTSSPSAGK